MGSQVFCKVVVLFVVASVDAFQFVFSFCFCDIVWHLS